MTTLIVRERGAAAYMLLLGITMVGRHTDRGWEIYRFDDSDGRASKALSDWLTNEARVAPRAYSIMIHNLAKGNVVPLWGAENAR